MSDTKFQVSKPSGSEEEDLFNIFYVFYGSNPGLPGVGHFGPGGH